MIEVLTHLKSSYHEGIPAAMQLSPRSQRVRRGAAKVPDPAVLSQQRAGSLIAADLTVVGEIVSKSHVSISGRVEGRINAATVAVEEGGAVEGTVLADTARICGTVRGEIKASSVSVGKKARISGKVFHSLLTIEPGAILDGVRPWRPHIDRQG
jgi:cytoskeletal protein CcmA (bactofilin family)